MTAGRGYIVDEVEVGGVVVNAVAVVRLDMCFDVFDSTLLHISSSRSSSYCIDVAPPHLRLVPNHRRSWRHWGTFNRLVLYSGPTGLLYRVGRRGGKSRVEGGNA